MNKKLATLATLALAGALALGGTASAYAASNNTTAPVAASSDKTVIVEQQKEQGKEADDQKLTAENTKTAITEDQAKQTALASVTDGVFNTIELEDEDGVIVYGVEIQSGANTYDVKVDANTGSIVKTDQGNDKEEKDGTEKDSKDGNKDNTKHENDNEDPAGHED